MYLLFYQPNSCTTHAESEWAGGTFLRQRRKVPPAHTQRVYFSVCPSVSPSVCLEYEKNVDLNVGILIRVSVGFSVRCPSPPNTYSYVQEENLGSTRKFVKIY
jgi:hypothetical protein